MTRVRRNRVPLSRKNRWDFALVMVAALLLVSGCAGTPASPSTRGVWRIMPATESAPPACLKYARSPAPAVAGGAPIVEAASRAGLPAGAVLSPGVQVLASTTVPGMYDAVVHVCSMPLSRRTLIAIGNSVASVIKADPSPSKLSTLTVQAWVQIGTDAAGEDPNTPSISLDFQNYAKSKPARAPESAWH
jgi:hypothetical protein